MEHERHLWPACQGRCFYATKPMLKRDTAWRALRYEAGLRGLRFHDLRHTVITELAEMGVADHVLESISGHLSRRMLEHYLHIRIDAKRQALDVLDAVRRSRADNGDGNGDGANQTEIPAIVEVSDDLKSQSRHSLLLQGSPQIDIEIRRALLGVACCHPRQRTTAAIRCQDTALDQNRSDQHRRPPVVAPASDDGNRDDAACKEEPDRRVQKLDLYQPCHQRPL